MTMTIKLITILISGLISMGSTQTCRETKELENNCGGYCYSVVKPILEHTVGLQKQVNSQDLSQRIETQSKFEYIERQLALLQVEVSKFKQNSVQGKVENFKRLFEKIGSKYYYIERHQLTNWFTAVHKCYEFGGHLASLTNDEDLYALTSKLTGQYYWIDVNDLSHEGLYLSLTTGNNAPYFNWHAGEPNNNGEENCVMLDRRDNVLLLQQ